MRRIFNVLLVLSVFLPGFAIAAYSQENQEKNINELKKGAPKIYIDCQYCDIDYIREKITFVNYVRDRKEADAHVLITTQRTGSGGKEYTLAFIGREKFSDINATLKFFTKQMDTEDEVRKKLVRTLKMGLTSYVANTPLCDLLSVDFKEDVKPTAVEDKWNFWVFNIGAYSYLNGQSTTKSISIYGDFSANRVIPESKLQLGLSASYSEDNFTINGTTISSTSESQGFNGLYVKSINDHWSVGGYLTLSSSTYSNIRFAVYPCPAVEYNFFPYSESTRRQLRCLYRIGFSFANYREETIYNKTKDNLLYEGLTLTLELKEPWGTISTSLEGTHYFYDFSKNRLVLSGEVSINIVKGLSLELWGSYSRIHDQLSLPKAGASYEEILLMRKELATDYRYYASIGLSYTFGSIYSNVVNPRFGNGY
ncbi:MAG: hypothetical protein JXB26_13960 [Candidatus Aminicenantes bacterium]|nr:hypothetical protein [Candidatus Aminicenantes bacterium]